MPRSSTSAEATVILHRSHLVPPELGQSSNIEVHTSSTIFKAIQQAARKPKLLAGYVCIALQNDCCAIEG